MIYSTIYILDCCAARLVWKLKRSTCFRDVATIARVHTYQVERLLGQIGHNKWVVGRAQELLAHACVCLYCDFEKCK